jgi:hypothetical protein
MDKKVDAVILWVDGEDPKHQQKIAPYLKKFKGDVPDFVASPTRYNSVGEIFYCVASILRFAPFINRIFIITDNQDPHVDEFVKKNFPKTKTEIKIIDHKVIFKGYEQYLPALNSSAIEACFHRIPELEDYFLYFNDDMFLMRPISMDDLFIGEKMIIRGNWRYAFLDRLLKYFKPKVNGERVHGFKDILMNSALYYGKKCRYIYLKHNARILSKKLFEEVYLKYPNVQHINLKDKLRDKSHFQTQSFLYQYALDKGVAVLDTNAKLLYMKPVNRGNKYVEKKINRAKNDENLVFGCIGSLDMATEKDRELVHNWMCELLNVEF